MIRVEGLRYSVGAFALDNVSLDVRPGEYFVLLGPSGSGKTLLLECLCGLNRVAAGRIAIGGRDVTHLEPRSRGIGYLPQDYALFPHCTVRGNVAFGLASRGLAPPDAAERVDRMLRLLGIAPLAGRLPARLSGGEKQRVALARALAIGPQALLLDEPVSALDEQTRDGVLRELRRLQQKTGTTAVHVCHSFAEMLAVADRAAVIYGGRILQVGTPDGILRRPATAAIARFVQSGNILPCRASADGDLVRLDSAEGFSLLACRREPDPSDGEVQAVIRPEHVAVWAEPPDPLPARTAVLEGHLGEATDQGAVVQLTVDCRGRPLTVALARREHRELALQPGQRLWLAVAAEDVHVVTR